MRARVKFLEKVRFLGETDSGFSIVLDASKDRKIGPSPMELLLVCLACCAAIGVVNVLNAMGEEFKSLEAYVDAERREEHPQMFKRIKIKYVVGGPVRKDVIEGAIKLTYEKYCPVAAMLRNGGVKIETECSLKER
ncbi:hypothetical protein DRN86_01385 [Candidatus Geothermarchaeota archaeon]|nr:MAG: hypothetical protein DRN86_01385 [Candidatus Geothermarchaeota archaeon]